VETPEIARPLSVYLSFLQAKELAGQERAVGAAGFATGRFEPARLRRFVMLGDKQDLYFSIIAGSATSSQTAFMQQTLAGEAADAVLRLRRIAAESSLDDVTGAAWFKVATVRIDLMKQIEDRMASDLKSMTSAIGEAARHALYTTAAAIVALLALTVAIGALSIRAIVRPLGSHIHTMQRLAVGDTDVVIAGANRRDELGTMARAISVFRNQAVENKHLAAAQETERVRAEADKRIALRNMADMIESETTKALADVSNRTTAMAATADSMSTSAARTGCSAQSAAGAATQTLANAQAVASAAEQLSSSIREISSQMTHSTALVSQAVSAGDETRATIDQLNAKVAAIGSVADMIREIAGRTNLLALNATIEAARAGEAGKGFAVVASEVKALAMQTARSTEEISRHLAEVRTATAASVEAVFRIGNTISQIDHVASSIAAAVEEQGAATAEIARNVAQTAQAADEMTSRIAEVSNEAQDGGRNAALVHDAAAGLETAVGELKRTVMRVVRTSTTEVDRRLTQRHEVALTGHLIVSGGAGRACRITDVSELGARIGGAAGMAVGTRGTLKVDGFETAISWCVRNQNADGLGISFDQDTATTAGVTAILQRLTRQAA
jgi:methyl-accepting chemotaxis protein